MITVQDYLVCRIRKSIISYDMRTDDVVYIFDDDSWEICTWPSPGIYLTVSSQEFRLRDVETGAVLRTCTHPHRNSGPAVVPKAPLVLWTREDGFMMLFDLMTGERKWEYRPYATHVRKMELAPDRTHVLSSGAGNGLYYWRITEAPATLPSATYRKDVHALLRTHQGTFLTSSDEVTVWDSNGNTITSLCDGNEGIMALAQLDSSRVLCGRCNGVIELWDLPLNQRLTTLEGHTDAVEDIWVDPEALQSVSVARDSTVRFFDLRTGKEQRVIQTRSLPISMLRIGARDVLITETDGIRKYDRATGNPLEVLSIGNRQISCAAALPDRRFVIIGTTDRSVEVWDVISRSAVKVLRGHTETITNVCPLPDGRRAISTSYDSRLMLWCLAFGKLLACLLTDVPVCALWADNDLIAAADSEGNFHLLRIV
jgi:WD40 repeat protein